MLDPKSLTAILLVLVPSSLLAQTQRPGCARMDSAAHAAMHGGSAVGMMGCEPGDSGFARLQERGRRVMGVDQYTSTHRFDTLADGGRIVLQRDSADAAGTRAIREHLQHIAGSFRQGDFSLPGQVHDREVPGTRVMAARRAVIAYTYSPLPRGGQVRIRSQDPAAVQAIHEFLAFQRQDHHAGGRTGP